jgi:hypothetical protein
MPRTKIPAAGGATPAVGKELLRITDEFDTVRLLIDAAWSAASDLLKGEAADPLLALLSVTRDKLPAARDALNVARGQKGGAKQ